MQDDPPTAVGKEELLIAQQTALLDRYIEQRADTLKILLAFRDLQALEASFPGAVSRNAGGGYIPTTPPS